MKQEIKKYIFEQIFYLKYMILVAEKLKMEIRYWPDLILAYFHILTILHIENRLTLYLILDRSKSNQAFQVNLQTE